MPVMSSGVTVALPVVFSTTSIAGVIADDIIPDEAAFATKAGASNCHIMELSPVVIFAEYINLSLVLISTCRFMSYRLYGFFNKFTIFSCYTHKFTS